jgi:hypothetical protein
VCPFFWRGEHKSALLRGNQCTNFTAAEFGGGDKAAGAHDLRVPSDCGHAEKRRGNLLAAVKKM